MQNNLQILSDFINFLSFEFYKLNYEKIVERFYQSFGIKIIEITLNNGKILKFERTKKYEIIDLNTETIKKVAVSENKDAYYILNIVAFYIEQLLKNMKYIKKLEFRENEEIESYVNLIKKMMNIVEKNHDETGEHIYRVAEFSKLIAQELNLSNTEIMDIEKFSPLHDIGKIMVPISILNKKNRLTKEEFLEIKKHTIFGADILGDVRHFSVAKDIAKYHHEKFDGSGYPNGLKGREIPLGARIVTIADIYDALRSPRIYKRGYSHLEAMRIILKGDGRVMPQHFDPDILKAFLKIHERFDFIYEKLKEENIKKVSLTT